MYGVTTCCRLATSQLFAAHDASHQPEPRPRPSRQHARRTRRARADAPAASRISGRGGRPDRRRPSPSLQRQRSSARPSGHVGPDGLHRYAQIRVYPAELQIRWIRISHVGSLVQTNQQTVVVGRVCVMRMTAAGRTRGRRHRNPDRRQVGADPNGPDLNTTPTQRQRSGEIIPYRNRDK